MSKSIQPPALSPEHPLAGRKTVQTIRHQQGQIVKLDNVNFGIQSAAADGVLLPVNLPDDFQQEGLNIVFSGKLKEINMNELMAGHPLELTHLQAE